MAVLLHSIFHDLTLSQVMVPGLGKIQRRAARMVHNNYDWQQSVTELLKELDWELLSLRRKTSRLLHKAMGGLALLALMPNSEAYT